ncbi:MAG TPA: hypothetical protein VIL88_11390 [Devosia sp.]|jgi:hypothetical protein|uniref:hypothetical protein n=1 Tax=Devosia sp. TaxID=1871048 RepID=UPI002F9543A7
MAVQKRGNQSTRARGCLLALCLPVVGLIGYFLYASYAPWLLFNPITRHLYSQRDVARGSVLDLVPDVFVEGSPRSEVREKLLAAGFEHWPRYPRDPQNEEAYRIWAGGNIACKYELLVTVRFDDADRLLGAENSNSAVCL